MQNNIFLNSLLAVFYCLSVSSCLGAKNATKSLRHNPLTKKISETKDLQFCTEAEDSDSGEQFCFVAEKNETNSAELCKALITMGKKYENTNQLHRAMDCYKAAMLINKDIALEAIESLEIKMKEELERKKQEEETQALLRGAQLGNASDAYKLGKIYFNSGQIENAIKMWTLASENKHPKAPYRLALMYEKGDKVQVDLSKAEQFYRIGATNGHPECAYITAKLLEIESQKNPNEKQKIEDEAFQLKKESANRGHAVAAAEIGYMYSSKGEHVKAKQYFEKAKKYATPNSTMTVSVRQIMMYNIAAEETKIIK